MPRRPARVPGAEELLDHAIDRGVDVVFDRATQFFDRLMDGPRQTAQSLPANTQIRCAVCHATFGLQDVEFASPHGTGWGTCKRCFKALYFNFKDKIDATRKAAADAAKNAARNAPSAAQRPPAGPMPWEVLGVDRDADADAVKKAYRALALQWHPDRVAPGAPDGEREKARAKFEQIQRAYDVMMKVRKAAT